MPDKEKERRCFDRVLSCCPKGQFATDIHALLRDAKNSTLDTDGERPDIILLTEKSVIGIEHFQADLLFHVSPKGKVQSIPETQMNHCKNLANNYKDEKLLDKGIRSGVAIKPLLGMLEERLNAPNEFDYRAFIKNFAKVCLEHSKRCDDYRKRLRERAPSKSSFLGCIVEMQYSDNALYYVQNNGRSYKQRIRGVPVTKDILSTIEQMDGFDFVVLCMNCFDKPDRKKKTICFYFRPSDISSCVEQQGMMILDSFNLCPSGKFSMQEEEVSHDGSENVLIKVRVEASSRVENRSVRRKKG